MPVPPRINHRLIPVLAVVLASILSTGIVVSPKPGS